MATASACSHEPVCIQAERRELALDERTPEGVTPAEVLAKAVGARDFTLNWVPDLTNAPSDSTTAHFELALRDVEPIEYIRTERNPDNNTDIGDDCGPSLHIPATLTLSTDDGALDERFDEALVYDLRPDASPRPSVSVAFDFDQLVGSLRVLATYPELEGQLVVELVDPTSIDGALEFTSVSRTSSGDVGILHRRIAHWGRFDAGNE